MKNFVLVILLVSQAWASTYYITPTGNDSNSGIDITHPWLTPNHPINCGDVILASAGAYDEVHFRVGSTQWHTVNCPTGDNVAWLKCATAFTCTITITTAGHDAMAPSQSYWGIQGWLVSAPTVHTNQCFNAYTDGAPTKHHIIFANNIAIGCGDGALTSAFSDYIAVVGNIAYNGAQDNDNCYSGIDMVAMTNSDNLPGTHIYIAGNYLWHNIDSNPCSGHLPTDGQGILLDSYYANNYSGQTVIDNNLSVFNGATGVQTFGNTGTVPAPTYIRYNTVYGNQTGSVNANPCAEINVNSSYSTRVSRNLVETTPHTCNNGVVDFALGSSFDDVTDLLSENFIYSLLGNNTNTDKAQLVGNITGSDPQFTNPVEPGIPNCSGFSTVTECMAPVIASFTPQNNAAKSYGFQPIQTVQTTDPLFPSWLCNVGLPKLITMHCPNSVVFPPTNLTGVVN